MKLKLKQEGQWKDKGYGISYSMCEVFFILKIIEKGWKLR